MAKTTTFGEKVIKAREKKEWPRSNLVYALHIKECTEVHEWPYKKSALNDCHTAFEAVYAKVTAIEKGNDSDAETVAAIAEVLGIDAPMPADDAAKAAAA